LGFLIDDFRLMIEKQGRAVLPNRKSQILNQKSR